MHIIFDCPKGYRGVYCIFFLRIIYTPGQVCRLILTLQNGPGVYIILEEYTPLDRCADYF